MTSYVCKKLIVKYSPKIFSMSSTLKDLVVLSSVKAELWLRDRQYSSENLNLGNYRGLDKRDDSHSKPGAGCSKHR